MSLCQYKDMFGKPREGSHSTRIPILDVALTDVVATLVGGYFISQIYNLTFFNAFIVLFIISIIAHRAFCVRTKVDSFLFPDYS